MKQLRAIACILSLCTLTLLCYGAFLPANSASANPSVNIAYPRHGQLVQGSVAVSVTYKSASGVNVTHLEFYVDKSLRKQIRLENPSPAGTHAFVWDTSGVPAGTHEIAAKAYDANGQPGDVAVSVYVDSRKDAPDSQAPSVEVREPRDGAVVSGITQIMVDALDNVGVKWVSFFLGNRFLFATNHPPYQYAWDTTRIPNGQHAIKVYAYDAGENKGEATPVVVNVNNPGGATAADARLSTAPATPAARPAAPQVAALTPQSSVSRVAGPASQAAGVRTPPAVSPSTTNVARLHPELVLDFEPARPSESMAGQRDPAMPASAHQARPTTSAPRSVATQVALADTRVADFMAPSFAGGARTSIPQVPPFISSGSTQTLWDVFVGDAVMPATGALQPSAMATRASAPAKVDSPVVGNAMAVRPVVAVVTPSGTPMLAPATGAQRTAQPAERAFAPVLSQPTAFAPRVVSLVTPGMVAAAPQAGARRLSSPNHPSANQAAEPFMPKVVALVTPGAASAIVSEPAPYAPQVMALLPPSVAAVPAAIAGDARVSAPRNHSQSPTVSGPSAGAPEVVALVMPEAKRGLTPSDAHLRLAAPPVRGGSPAVSTTAENPTVMIALVDRKQQRALPLAVVVPQQSEPPASRLALPTATKAARVEQKVAAKKGDVTVLYAGRKVAFDDVKPFCREGMALAPFRHIFEETGGTVMWNNLIKQVKATGDGRKIEFTIGELQAMVNNNKVQMQTAPFLKDGRAIVPLSFVREALDVVVQYDPATGRVSIAAK